MSKKLNDDFNDLVDDLIIDLVDSLPDNYNDDLDEELNNELKPCPFCGSNDYEHSYTATCSNCFCFSDVGSFSDEKACIKAWNTRPIEDKLNVKIEKLKEALKQINEIASRKHILGLFESEFQQIKNIIKSLDKGTNVPANDTEKSKGGRR